MAILFLVNLCMFLQGRMFIKIFANVTKMPASLLITTLVNLCVVGAFAINNSTFDIYIVLVFGVMGYFMSKLDIPWTPMIIAMILGPIAESNMRRALSISGGSWAIFFTRPLCLAFILISVVSLVYPFVKENLIKRKG
jgi:putative tricarboxylic transport membrane protein